MTRPPAALPFTALVGQESMKEALVLNAINPTIGGVLIRGEKGTAKSTAVRALARLLPEIEVVGGCRFGCPPDQPEVQCADCRDRVAAGETLPVLRRRMRVVELPINASEDRVVGTIDIEAAIRSGERRFEPGVLAEANRNILYVDEVNLLDDHLVDVLLDAAAMGVNVVEREGISVWHPSRFILVGTMNPEEGELRPQLLDRFGLCVDVRGLRSLDERVRIMEQEARREDGDLVLHDDYAAEEIRLSAEIVKAEELLPLVEVPAEMRHFVSLVCIDAGVGGHRADITVSGTARTLCALREAHTVLRVGPGEKEREHPTEALCVTAADVIRAAELALPHRRTERRSAEQRPDGSEGIAERAQHRLDEMQAPQQESETGDAASESGESSPGASGSDQSEGSAMQSPERTDAQEPLQGQPQVQFEGELFPVRRIQLPRDRRTRRTPGKRSLTRSGDKRGRYVRATTVEHTTDLAFDATLRAAAPHQETRRREGDGDSGLALRLERQDLRQKVRQRKTGTLIVFVVDASASMDAEQRMQATKGAILSLLRDAYVRRDRVALVVFSGRTARVVLRPTASIDLAEARLQRLAVGGTTPLTHGLVAGLKLIHTERLRDPTVYPLMVLISDGRGNISLFGEEPLVEAQRVAAQIKAEKIRALVIDSARDYMQQGQLPRIGGRGAQPLFGGYGFNACLDLAERLGGRYFGLYDLSQGAILQSVEQSLRSM